MREEKSGDNRKQRQRIKQKEKSRIAGDPLVFCFPGTRNNKFKCQRTEAQSQFIDNELQRISFCISFYTVHLP